MTENSKIAKIGLSALKLIPSTEFSVEDFKTAFDGEIEQNFGCKNTAEYMRIKPDIFEILQVMADEYLPTRLIATLGTFAEIKQLPQGAKYEFKVRKGHQRGKKFVTQVASSGEYETFRLDSTSFQIPVKAYGAAALVDWERFLNGDESFVELMQIIAEGMEDKIYGQVQSLLQASMNSSARPAANKTSQSSFSATEMDKLIAVVRAYGAPMIWCTQEFAATMSNQISYTSATPTISEADLNDIRNQGYIGKYKGTPIIIIPQSFTDQTNSTKVMNPKYAYIIPAGEEKIVKIILEGDTQIEEFKNRDWSSEMEMYRKVGAAIVTDPNYWAIYYNSSLS